MEKVSILLGLSGSEQSKFAAEVAWSLAEKSGADVTAEHVIDSKTMWELLRNDKPGFVGSGLYISAYEAVLESMKNLAKKLVEKYDAMADSKTGIKSSSIISEGNPVQILSMSAKAHDLVVIGHQPRPAKDQQDRSRIVRYAIAEGLAHECTKPLLVVQNEVNHWKSMTILLSFDHLNFEFVKACVALAEVLEIKPKIVAIGGGAREEKPDQFLKDMREAHPEFKDVEMEAHTISGITVEDVNDLWHPEGIDLKWKPDPDTLMVIPTRESSGSRITIFDTSPSAFVRNLTLPAILMWPEENTSLINREGAKSEVKQA